MSPENHLKKVHSFNSGKRIGKMSVNVDMKVLEGLNDIINDFESDPTKSSSVHGKEGGRKFSWNAEPLPISPSKPKKKRAKRRGTLKTSDPLPAQHKINTMFDLSKIVAGLGEVLEEGKNFLFHESKKLFIKIFETVLFWSGIQR